MEGHRFHCLGIIEVRYIVGWIEVALLTSTAEQESQHDQVIRELAERTGSYSNASQIGLILAATQAEDLTWLLEYLKERFASLLILLSEEES
jgi:hypothetical protein